MEKEEKKIEEKEEVKKEEKNETKREDNKEYTNNDSMVKKFLPVIIIIVVIFVLFIIFASLTKSCSKAGSNYKGVQNKLVDAAKSYYNSHKDDLPELSDNKVITDKELSDGGYMKPMTKLLKDTSCEGKVYVYNNGGNYLYVPDLVCSEYKTEHLIDKIKEDNLIETNVTDNTSSTGKVSIGGDYISGLYDVNGTFIFKGKDPKNFFSFGGVKWRILNIDTDGTIRLIKIAQEKRNSYWDTKYNNDINRYYGINDYKNSQIKELITGSYDGFKDENKLHLAPFNVCTARRASNNLSKDRGIDCAEVLEKQYIALSSVSDYANASLDENCVNINDGACSNYNYLIDILVESWTTTGSLDDTYNVYFINGGIASLDYAKKFYPYNWVISINGNELYLSGDGSEDDPYTINK